MGYLVTSLPGESPEQFRLRARAAADEAYSDKLRRQGISEHEINRIAHEDIDDLKPYPTRRNR